MADAVGSLLTRLQQINEMGAPLPQERDLTCLLERILLAAKASTNADGGTLCRRMEDGQALRAEILRADSRCGLPREALRGDRFSPPDPAGRSRRAHRRAAGRPSRYCIEPALADLPAGRIVRVVRQSPV